MKKSNYLVFAITAFALIIFNSAFAQKGTYKVSNDNKVTNISDYQKAMDKANFDAYRYINRRRRITFDTGVEIELLSVYELQKLNIPVDASKGRIYNKAAETNPVYSLGKNLHILAAYTKEQTK